LYKFYVVGLGGSGGKTLQFLMDQLASELRDRGWTHDHLPRCWQFVHIDVPHQPDGVDKDEGLPPTVPDQGGTYLGVTTPADQYQQLDTALARSLSDIRPGNALRQLVRWRPDAGKVNFSIVNGAGQYRAVGRLATLARSNSIYGGLVAAAQDLMAPTVHQDITELRQIMKLGSAQGTIVLVVSSLAGGTGASMTLDVCNLLRGVKHEIPQFPGDQAIAYLYTPDVFGKLDAAKIAGVNANALGTISELMAAQAASRRPWTDEEWSVYGTGAAPGKATGRGPYAVFPVGATNGISGALFGDGKSTTIYRGFARALAAILLSESQQNQLTSYVLGNFGSQRNSAVDLSELSWAPDGSQEAAPFSALGFASIGLGRDRFAEYAAQRLARLAVERLLRGHIDTSVLQGRRTDQEALAAYANEGYSQFLRWAGLPDSRPTHGDPLTAWVGQIWPIDRQRDLVGRSMGEMFGELRHGGVQQTAAWFAGHLRDLIPRYFHRVTTTADTEAHNSAQMWVRDIQTRIETAVMLTVGRFGIPVAQRILERFEVDLRSWGQLLRTASLGSADAAQVSADSVTPLVAINGRIQSDHAVLTTIETRVNGELSIQALRRGGLVAADLVEALAGDVIAAMVSALSGSAAQLAGEENAIGLDGAVATVRTTVIQAWPEDDRVPSRFATATNEVLLEAIDTYPGRFRAKVTETFATTVMPGGGHPDDSESRVLALEQIATFLEVDPSGQQTPKPVDKLLVGGASVRGPFKIGRRADWWPRLFAGAASHQSAWYEPQLSGPQILDGARRWVGRDGYPLKEFVRQGIKRYLSPPNQTASKTMLEEGFAAKFSEALELAAPLVGVDPNMVSAVHGEPVRVSYQFSATPLQTAPEAVKQIKLAIQANPAVDTRLTSQALDAAMTGPDSTIDVPRIDIIGTYARPYSPIVFSSLQQPIQAQWSTGNSVGQRLEFWRWRRGRPLTDFAPVSPEWLQAFVTGWLVGRFTGEIQTPVPGDRTSAIRVYDDRVWRQFPDPLIGVQQINKDLTGWAIPAAVIESMPLAIAQCHGDPSLTPLQAYVATRRLGQELPLTGYELHPAIRSWLVDGVSRSGQLPQIVRADVTLTDAEQRLKHATEWLNRLIDAVSSKLLPQSVEGAPGGGEFSTIDQHNFRDVPREWEIAELIVVGARQVLAELRRPDYLGSVVTDDEHGIDDVEA